MNKIIKISIIVLISIFFSLYLANYNIKTYENKRILTEESIKQYEKDLKEGKDIKGNQYVVKEKNYNNKASNIGRKASKIVENCFKKALKIVMNYLNHLQ